MITKDEVFAVVSDEDIYSAYLGSAFYNRKGNITSPFREESVPSFSFIRRGSKLLWHDFGSNETGDSIAFVMKMFNISFVDALHKIKSDIHSNICYSTYTNQSYKPKKGAVISIIKRSWTQAGYGFWKQFGISPETLARFNVHQISCVITNDFVEYVDELSFAYEHIYGKNKYYKIYRPLLKTKKFRSNIPLYVWSGINQLQYEPNRELIITKSLKDVMCLHELGYKSISPQSENARMPKDVLQIINMFDKVYILFDYDRAGVSACNKLRKEYRFNPIFINTKRPLVYKDTSDAIKLIGKEETNKIIKNTL